MNIFYLHEDPIQNAKWHIDKHIVKMPIEYAQLMSTAHRLLDGIPEKRRSKSGKTIQTYYTFGDVRDKLYYLAVHKYHPCTTWTTESEDNYRWHYCHFTAMAEEYEYRRGKIHKTWDLLGMLLAAPP